MHACGSGHFYCVVAAQLALLVVALVELVAMSVGCRDPSGDPDVTCGFKRQGYGWAFSSLSSLSASQIHFLSA